MPCADIVKCNKLFALNITSGFEKLSNIYVFVWQEELNFSRDLWRQQHCYKVYPLEGTFVSSNYSFDGQNQKVHQFGKYDYWLFCRKLDDYIYALRVRSTNCLSGNKTIWHTTLTLCESRLPFLNF